MNDRGAGIDRVCERKSVMERKGAKKRKGDKEQKITRKLNLINRKLKHE